MGKDKNFMEDYLEGRDVYMMLIASITTLKDVV